MFKVNMPLCFITQSHRAVEGQIRCCSQSIICSVFTTQLAQGQMEAICFRITT